MLRLLLCGDGHGALATLQGLVESGFRPEVLTDDPAVSDFAHCSNLELVRTSITEWIRTADDVVFSSAFRARVLKSDIDRCRIINIHYAPLPRYRGLHATVWAMLNGEKEVGFTIHEMDEYLDSGPVIYQERVPVNDKTSWELMLEMDERSRRVVGDVLKGYLSGKIKPIPQIEGDAIFVGRRNLEDCRVDWKTWDAQFFQRALKALVTPYPLPFFEWKGTRYEIADAEVVHRYYREIPGHVVYIDASSVWIKLTDGLLRIRKLKRDSETIDAKAVFARLGTRLS